MQRLRKILTLMLMLLVLAPCGARDSKKVKDLKNQKAKIQQAMKKNQKKLEENRKDVKLRQATIKYLDDQIEMRVQFIHTTEHQLDSLNGEVDKLKEEIRVLDSILTVKKTKYTRALRMAQTYRKVQSPLLFALSAHDVTQMYRRLRYIREYAGFERNLGEQIEERQAELMEKQNQMLELKSQVNEHMRVLIAERAKLNQQQVEQREVVTGLKKAQKGLQQQIGSQQKQIAALDKKIDQVVAYEIEQARKRAEAEAKRKAEEERKRQEAAAKKGTATKSESASASTGSKSSTSTSSSKSSGSASKWMTAEEKALNGTFEQNKGRLPVPITGQYMIGNHYGSNLSGMAHVQLNNNGTNYVGRAGARARAIFDGEVSAVFSFGGLKNILIRHGSYISVYCNLSSVIVSKGQKVHTRDLIGTVADDGTGQYVLHFQLRKETAKLNPESWIGR